MNRPLTLKEKMESTYLVQRLTMPTNSINPFSFGGGLKNGGLSDKVMDLIKGIFSFDYMGSSEFEWGAVPNALKFIVEQVECNNIIANIMECKPGEYVYYISPKQYENEVKNRINQLRNHELFLKEYCGLDTYFDGLFGKERKDVCGWIELDNGFMFFTNETMYIQTCKLFGIYYQIYKGEQK